MYTNTEALLIAFLWTVAGFVWGWASRRGEIEKLRMDIANRETAWKMERLIWSRHK